MTVNYVLQNSSNALIGKSADYLASENIFEITSSAESMACKLVYSICERNKYLDSNGNFKTGKLMLVIKEKSFD